jgi:hypothetical protein
MHLSSREACARPWRHFFEWHLPGLILASQSVMHLSSRTRGRHARPWRHLCVWHLPGLILAICSDLSTGKLLCSWTLVVIDQSASQTPMLAAQRRAWLQLYMWFKRGKMTSLSWPTAVPQRPGAQEEESTLRPSIHPCLSPRSFLPRARQSRADGGSTLARMHDQPP